MLWEMSTALGSDVVFPEYEPSPATRAFKCQPPGVNHKGGHMRMFWILHKQVG